MIGSPKAASGEYFGRLIWELDELELDREMGDLEILTKRVGEAGD